MKANMNNINAVQGPIYNITITPYIWKILQERILGLNFAVKICDFVQKLRSLLRTF